MNSCLLLHSVWFDELVVELIECLQSNSLNQINKSNQNWIGKQASWIKLIWPSGLVYWLVSFHLVDWLVSLQIDEIWLNAGNSIQIESMLQSTKSTNEIQPIIAAINQIWILLPSNSNFGFFAAIRERN